MQIFRTVLNRNPVNFELIPVYDIHFGTVFHDKHLFNRLVRYIQDNENAYWFCGGDIADFLPLQDKRFEYDILEKSFKKNLERILTYTVEYATEKLKPIANKCLFMISGNHDCVVWNTEVLTSNGWKKAIEIDYNDKVAQFDIKTKTITFSNPIKISKFFTDEWVEVITNLSEEAVTLNHSLVIDGRLVKVEKIINKGFKQNQQYHAGYLDDKYRQKINLSEDWIKLLTWVVMDGTWVIYSERKMRIQFKLSKERKIKKLTSLLKKLKIPYTIKPATKCKTNKMQPYLIRIYGENACKIVNLLERKKKIPKSWAYGLSPSQVKAMLETIADTDGYKRNNRIQWASIDIENLETVQLACIFNGIPCRIVKVKYSKNGFSRNRQFIYMAYIYLGPIKGYKAKFTVYNEKAMAVAIETSKGTLITRRNGKISFTGNSTYRIRFGFDPISSICKNLGIKNYTNSYEALVKILFKHNRTSSLTLYAHHGHGYSKVRSGTLLNPLEDAMTNFDADIFIMGHSHYLVFTYKNFLTLNNSGTRLKVKQKLLLRVGGFRFSRKVGNCSYEEKRGMRPNATGTYIIKVIANPYPVGSLKFSVIPFI